MRRTHTCGELTDTNEGSEVVLDGWVHSRRDHGGIVFVDLRDRYGITQVVFDPKVKGLDSAEALRREDVIEVTGKVRPRPKGMENPKIVTGKIEIEVKKLDVLNKAETPPIEVDDRVDASEDMRLKYRYIDLRRPKVQKNLITRHRVITAAREYFNSHGFIDVSTPILVKSTPEGARDYVVPSRVHAGKFYALPQSPQLYKQILMIAGMDRYYQVACCLRDEDLRADRQPEHFQFDLEMSFVESEDIRNFVEGLYKHLFKTVLNIKLDDFPRITYKESMDKYGNDKPDIRYELFLHEVTDIVVKSDFGVFKDVQKNGGIVKCINPEKNLGRNDIDGYIAFAQQLGAKGMAWMRVTDKGLESNIAKYFPEAVQKELIARVNAKPNSILMFIADEKKKCNEILSKLRAKLAEDLKLYNPNDFKFSWIYDFPLFAWNADENRWEPEHHMFSMPKQEFIPDFEKRPGEVIGDLWDLALNGLELGSGSIRINVPSIQERVMNFIGLSKEEADMKFGFLLEAYKYGGPPHGGMGLGIDRTVAMMCGTSDIREVIAFPKNKAAECPMDGCPSEIDSKQLKEIHVKLDIIEVQKKDVVFEKIIESLDKNKINYEVLEHKAVYTSKEAAEVRGTELKQGCKALIVKRDGRDFVMAVVSGANELDSQKLAKLLSAKNITLPTADEVKVVAGCSIGAVPPFGNLFGLKVYFDKSVAANDVVAFNAGMHTKSLKMKYKDLKSATGGEEGEFSK